MGETHPCTVANCDKVFSKPYELKKHRATHDCPTSVFYCSKCDFITLQKKNLGIHFALHTGEKIHGCPDTISFISAFGSSIREERCEYRTNDPAALSRHRKKAHGYVPPLNRTRLPKTVPAAPRQKKDKKVSRYCRRSQRPIPVSRRKLSRVPGKASNFSSGPDYMTAAAQSPKNCAPFLRQGDAGGDAMVADCYEESGYDPSGATLISPDEEIGLDSLYDPSFRSQWMAKYEEGYSTFDTTGLRHLPKHLHAVPPSAPAGLDIQTGREGCLCPEWMVEAGIEGWDQSVFGTHKEY